MNREEAIKIVRKLYYDSLFLKKDKEAIETLIPELKESEDEMIRKDIIETIKIEAKEFPSSVIASKAELWLAWLEKQGKTDIQVILPTFTFDDILALQCCMKTVEKVQKDEELYNQLKSLHDRLHDAYWLEKQGEQKPIISNNALREGIAHFGITQYQIDNWLKKYVDIEKQAELQYWKPSEEQLKALDYAYNCCPDTEKGNYYEGVLETLIDELYKLQEKQSEQKPADKVEPKFRVGDWITKNDDSSIIVDYSCCEITKVENGNYTIESIYGYKGYNTFETFEKDYHLWTIQDAKDGDVLVTKKGNPFLYDKNRYNNELAYYYVGLDANKELVSKSHHSMLNHFGKLSSISPATKEQHDLLFQKMKEAGYKWNAENKELKITDYSKPIKYKVSTGDYDGCETP